MPQKSVLGKKRMRSGWLRALASSDRTLQAEVSVISAQSRIEYTIEALIGTRTRNVALVLRSQRPSRRNRSGLTFDNQHT